MESFIEDRVPYSRRVFCNRNLRLDRIQFIGFDMDYTLALYTEQIEHLQAEMVLDRMVSKYGYPREILAAAYDPGFAIRGLTVDLPHGNVFKMDRHRYVGRIWHGSAPLSRDLREQIYTNRKITPSDPRFVMVDTLFALPEISLYSQLVAYFDGLDETASKPTYEKLWVDLREAMDSLHRDDSLKCEIRARLADFVILDDEIAETLHRFRSAGKKLFLLTNSEPEYTEAVMSFLLDGCDDSYPSWKDYFEFVLTAARKPSFFQSDEPFEAADNPSAEVTVLKRGHIYSGGSFVELARLTGMMGEDVLYVGDHIYGDILRSKIHTHWRTAMVVQEMERELEQIQARSGELAALASLEEQRFQLNLELTARALDGDRAKKVRTEVKRLGLEISKSERANADAFNPYWGMLFRDRTELSAFGSQVEDYACIYTSRASNFRLYSPLWYFRSPRDRMAHE
jgi:HAD superfamily 5'-nucleotidase-like hydrolase